MGRRVSSVRERANRAYIASHPMIRSTHSLPEVQSLTPRRRNVLTNAAGRTWGHHVHFFGTLGLGFALLAAPFTFRLPFRLGLASLLGALFVTVVYFPVGARLLRTKLQRIMVNRRGRPFVCFQCGYRLLGLDGSHCCPECGQVAAAPAGGRLRRPRRLPPPPTPQPSR